VRTVHFPVWNTATIKLTPDGTQQRRESRAADIGK